MAIYNKVSWLGLGVLFLLSSCGGAPEKKEMNGQVLYQNKCALCHGAKGDLGISDAADLTVSQKSLEEIMQYVKKGSPSMKMPPQGGMDDDQVKAVAEYAQTLRK